MRFNSFGYLIRKKFSDIFEILTKYNIRHYAGFSNGTIKEITEMKLKLINKWSIICLLRNLRLRIKLATFTPLFSLERNMLQISDIENLPWN